MQLKYDILLPPPIGNRVRGLLTFGLGIFVEGEELSGSLEQLSVPWVFGQLPCHQGPLPWGGREGGGGGREGGIEGREGGEGLRGGREGEKR